MRGSLLAALCFLIICAGAIIFGSIYYIETAQNKSFAEHLEQVFDITPTAHATPTTMPTESVSMPTADNLMSLPKNSTGAFKAYMDYRKITDRKSSQYHLQKIAHTDINGFRRFGGYFLVAMGSYYAQEIGQTYEITFFTGQSIKVMIGDAKRDKDCVKGMYCRVNKSIVEFIVDTKVMSDKALESGDMSYFFEDKIVQIREVR